MTKKSIIIFTTVFLVSLLFFGFFVLNFPQKAQASTNWLTGWEARRIINITNLSSQDLVDYEVNVDIGYDERMNPGFSDIRFTNTDGTTLLNYGWDINDNGSKKKIDEDNATAVVKIPTLSANATRAIYMYYDNPSAASAADLSTALTWFDHFTSNRSNEYDYHDLRWIPRSSILQCAFCDGYVSPKNVSVKNFIVKLRGQEGYNGYGTVGLRSRKIDADNFWQAEFNPSEGGQKPRFGYRQDGIDTWRARYNDAIVEKKWYTITMKMYETEIFMSVVGEEYERTFEAVDNTLNIAGRIEGVLHDRQQTISLFDYLYVRQYVKPEPVVEFGIIEIQEIIPNLQIPEPLGWFNTDWEQRQQIIIDNTENRNTLTDYEFNVDISYDPAMNFDFSDIRFTDEDGTTPLNYGWDINDDGAEKKTDDTTATAVVKVPHIPALSVKAIYVYWSNPSAANSSDLSATLAWFDHFRSNRSNEYDYHDLRWIPRSSILQCAFCDGYVSPKNVSVKNFIVKLRGQEGYNGYGTVGLRSRKIDADNFWQAEFNPTEGWQKPRFGYRQDGVDTWRARYNDAIVEKKWYTITMKMYETEIFMSVVGEEYERTFETIDETLNASGRIEGVLHDHQRTISLFDYLYVRQATKPMPTLYGLGDVEVQEITPIIDIPPSGWFDTNWQKRQRIIIDNTQSRNDLTNYEVNVEILYNSEMNTDFSDIRFTDEDGITLLNYGWDINDDGIEKRIDNISAVAVVQVSSIPARTRKAIYMYYNNPDAESTANLSTTLTWFDHFTTDRKSEYDTNLTWLPQHGVIRCAFCGNGYVSPKNISLKNVFIRTRGIEDYKGSGTVGLNSRKIDSNNYWRMEFNPGQTWERPRFGYVKNGVDTWLATYRDDIVERKWYTLNTNMYETEIEMSVRGQEYERTFETITNTLNVAGRNVAGRIEGVLYDQGTTISYFDYVYVRQTTKPWPTVELDIIESQVQIINVAVILAEPFNSPHKTDEACLDLIDENGQFYEKCYEDGHTKDYYYDLANNLVNDYYNENAYGTIEFNFEVFDNEGIWYKFTDDEKDEEHYGENFKDMPLPLPDDVEFKDGKYDLTVGSDAYGRPIIHEGAKDRSATFIWDVINLADENIYYNEYDIIVVVHSGKSEQTDLLGEPKNLLSLAFPVSHFPINSPDETAKNWISVSETELTGVLVHELGHNLGVLLSDEKEMLPDLYSGSRNGDIEYWGTMGNGYELPIKLNIFPQYTRPSHLSSYSKLYFNWLTPELIGKGTHIIESLETMEYGSVVKKYDLPDNSYYLLEARTRDETYSTWDAELPGIPSDWLVIYKVKKELINNEQNDIVNIIKTIDTLGIDPRPLKDAFDNLIGLVNWSKEENSFKMSAEITDWSPSNYIGLYLKTKIEVLEHVWDSFPVSLASIPNEQIIKLEVKDFTIPSNDQNILAANSSLEEGKDTSIIGSKAAINPPAIYFICLRIKPWLWSILIVIVLAIILLLYSLIKRLYPRIRLQRKVYIFILLLILCIIGTFFIVKLLLYCQAEIIEERQYRQGVENDTYTNPPHQFFSSIGLASASGISGILSTVPDLDLHAYDDQGRHVGVNYETGEYEHQIPGAETSGDLVYDNEWIFVPEGTDVHFVVSSQDIQNMLEEFPELQELTDGIETYEAQAIYYDAESQRYESNILTEQIESGVLLEHPVTGTVDITVLPAQPFDIIPPTTSISLSDTIGQNDWYLTDVIVTLTAVDNENGTGVDITEYSFDQQVWQTYIQPFTISEEGIHTLYYRSIDKAGNVEETKSIEIKIDKTLPQIVMPIFEGSYIYKTPLTIEFSAFDVVSGIFSILATLNNQPIISGQQLILDQFGTNVFTVTAIDYAGHAISETKEFKVFYDFSGFLPPLAKKTQYNLGQTIPVKFQLQDYQGNYISDIQPQIYIAEVINGVPQLEQPAISSGKANQENIARYDPDKDQYIFNLSIKDLFPDQYQIRADLGDESLRTITVNLKKGKR